MKLKGTELNGTYRVEFHDRRFEVYDKNGNVIYYENSDGDWAKIKYDKKGNEIYYEDSDGNVVENGVKELTIKEIESLLGYKIKIKGENKWN